jgi:ketosteroid isomerase-like protein
MKRSPQEEQLVLAAQGIWREIRSGDVPALRSSLHSSFQARGFPLSVPEGGGTIPAEETVRLLAEFFREGAELTNVGYRLGGTLAQDRHGIVQIEWMAERGLGEKGSPRYVSGQVTMSFLKEEAQWRCSGWLGCAGPHGAEESEKRAADLAAIREQILRVFEAYRQKDESLLRRTHTADWRGFALSSATIGRGINAYMGAARKAIGSMVFETYRILELDAIFYGDIAVVPYVAVVAGRTARGRIQESRLRVMDVYLREPSGWNQIASNVCLHPGEIRGGVSELRERSRGSGPAGSEAHAG